MNFSDVWHFLQSKKSTNIASSEVGITAEPLLPEWRTAQLYDNRQQLSGVKFIAIPPTKGGIA